MALAMWLLWNHFVEIIIFKQDDSKLINKIFITQVISYLPSYRSKLLD